MKIKPCPFCGGEARVTIFLGRKCVACTNCLGAIMPAVGMTKEDAIETWNRREPIDKVVEQLEEVSFVDIDEECADDGQRMLFLHDAIEIVKKGGAV